jgi:hypothetical protein
MLTQTKAEELDDLLVHLGESFSIGYVAKGSKERQFQVIGGGRFARRILDEFLQDARMLSLSAIFADGQMVRLK